MFEQYILQNENKADLVVDGSVSPSLVLQSVLESAEFKQLQKELEDSLC